MAEVVEAPVERTGVRRGRGALFAAVAIACGAALLVAGQRWTAHPTAFEPYSSVNVTGTMPIGTTFFSDTGVVPELPPPDDQEFWDEGGILVPPVVIVESAVPRIVENTSGASVELLVCIRNGSTTGIGNQTDGLEESCSSLEPFVGPRELQIGFSTTQLVVRHTSSQRGVLEVDGVDLTYRDGLQSGTQHVGTGFRFEFVPESELPPAS